MADGSPTLPEIRSSRCITEHVTATLDYKLTNYLQLKGMGVGNLVSSRVLRVGGHGWKIDFYPDGVNSDCAGNASCFLLYLGRAKVLSAKFALSMMETNGQEQVASHAMADRKFKPSPGNDWGYAKFVDRSKLKSRSRLGDGCFTIRCVLTVRKDSPPLELPGHLERLLGDERGADVTFSVGGEEFCAHRSLLAARSPIFAAQLFVPMAEKDSRRYVEVMDMEPTTFRMMLHYIYTDALPLCSDNGGANSAPVMQHLLVAAERYGLDRLKQICEDELCKGMDVETIMTTLALANQHQCERLKKACVTFMASTEVMAAVVETDGFKEHLKACSRPLGMEGSPKEKRQRSTQRKYFLRSTKKEI
ncbi:unnamed protein product [Alopecurus aequalis]